MPDTHDLWYKRILYQHGHAHLCGKVAQKFLLDAVSTYQAEQVRFDVKRRERLHIAHRADTERRSRANAAARAQVRRPRSSSQRRLSASHTHTLPPVQAAGQAAGQAAPTPVPARDVGRPHHNSSLTGSPAYYALQKRRALATLSRCGTPARPRSRATRGCTSSC